MPKPRPLALERLERRDVPAVLATGPHDFQHLTLSFAADGTNVDQYTSQLSAALQGQNLSTAAWQTEILRAVQTWAQYANVNLGLVREVARTDLWASPTGNAVAGDVRVAGVNMASGQVAVATPYDPAHGSPVGSVVINTAYNFGSGQGMHYDLQTVALHEIGHVLGLGDSNDPSSVMYEHYQGPRGLGVADVAAIQARFGGPRLADAFDAAGGNNTAATATGLDPAAGAVEADITAVGDLDFYRFTAPDRGNTKVAINVQAAGLSLLVPRVTVYDAAGHVVASAEAGGPLDNDVGVRLKLDRGASYFVRVTGATGDAFGVGSYRLQAEIKSIDGDGLTSALAGVADPTAAAAALADPGQSVSFAPEPGARLVVLRLKVTETQVLRFDVSASGPAGGTLTLLDGAGQTVALLAAGGSASHAWVLLAPGIYSFRLDPGAADLAKVTYTLGIRQVSDPIDAYPLDPTDAPVAGKVKGTGPTTVTTATAGGTWLVLNDGLALDPISSPYVPGT